MRAGDISNVAAPHLLFVWEGLLAHCADEVALGRALRRRRPNWREVADLYVPNTPVVARVLDIARRVGFGIDVVTYLPPAIRGHVEAWCDRYLLPAARVTASTPRDTALRLLAEPGLLRIYDGNPARALTYGPRGQVVTDPEGIV